MEYYPFSASLMRSVNYLRQFEGQYLISLNSVCRAVRKNTQWFSDMGGQNGLRRKIKEESRQHRYYFPVSNVVEVLTKSILSGDLLSYDLLRIINDECKLFRLEIDIPIDKYNLRQYFDDWVRDREDKSLMKRDNARESFCRYIRDKTKIDYAINRNYFSKIINDANERRGNKIKKKPKKIKGQIVRVYDFR